MTNQIINEKILEITYSLYKLTILFPKKEPLRYKLREVAIDLMANIIRLDKMGSSNLSKNLFSILEKEFKVLKSFFQIVKRQNWLKQQDILILEKEYQAIEQKIFFPTQESKDYAPSAQKRPTVFLPPFGLDKESTGELDVRQKKVLKILQQKKQAQIGQLSKDFPQISRRTLLRDLEKLSQTGFVVRQGNGRGAIYRFVTFPRHI